MLTTIKQSLELCMIITAQLKCAKEALDKGNYDEARRYLEMAKHTADQVKREVKA